MLQRVSTRLLVASSVVIAACGGSPAPTITAPAVAASSAPPAVSSASVATSAPTRREASDALRQRWVFDDDVQFAAYADLHGLLTTELFGGLVPMFTMLVKTVGGDQAAGEVECAQKLLEVAQEMSFGVDDRGSLLTVQLALGAGSRISDRCRTIFTGSGEDANLTGDTLVLGDGVLVESSKRAPSGHWPPGLELDAERYVAWSLHADGVHQGKGGLLVSPSRFVLDAEGHVGEHDARGMEEMLSAVPSMAKAEGLPSEQAEVLRHLLGAVRFQRDGASVKMAFELDEPVVEQARDLGAAATLAIYGVRRYLADAKTAEARNTVGQIAKDIAATYEMETLPPTPRSKKRLASYPAVPKSVPSGLKVQTSPADWKAWAPIKFMMDTPQYYQYEVKAAKDGMSCEVFAHGDLDGDAKVSTFRVKIHIDPKTRDLLIAPRIEEQDPTE